MKSFGLCVCVCVTYQYSDVEPPLLWKILRNFENTVQSSDY